MTLIAIPTLQMTTQTSHLAASPSEALASKKAPTPPNTILQVRFPAAPLHKTKSRRRLTRADHASAEGQDKVAVMVLRIEVVCQTMRPNLSEGKESISRCKKWERKDTRTSASSWDARSPSTWLKWKIGLSSCRGSLRTRVSMHS